MVILENIDIDIDIDKAILQNIDIDEISNRFKFGISNRATRKSDVEEVKFNHEKKRPIGGVTGIYCKFTDTHEVSKFQPFNLICPKLRC